MGGGEVFFGGSWGEGELFRFFCLGFFRSWLPGEVVLINSCASGPYIPLVYQSISMMKLCSIRRYTYINCLLSKFCFVG